MSSEIVVDCRIVLLDHLLGEFLHERWFFQIWKIAFLMKSVVEDIGIVRKKMPTGRRYALVDECLNGCRCRNQTVSINALAFGQFDSPVVAPHHAGTFDEPVQKSRAFLLVQFVDKLKVFLLIWNAFSEVDDN